MVVAAQQDSSLLAELELCVRARSPLPWLQPRARRAPYCDRAPAADSAAAAALRRISL